MATVVVIDDSPSDRRLAETLMKYAGHDVRLSSDAMGGLALIRSEKPDLIITDLITPAIDGYELARTVRSDPATAAIPIVMVTAHYQEREVQRLATQIGIQRVVIKPYDPQVLLDAVAEALGEQDTGDRTAQSSTDSEFQQEHMRLVSSKLHEKVRDLELLRSNRCEFLASLGTEMQTHLSALLGCSEVLARQDRRLDARKRDELLEEIQAATRRLMALAEDVLELSRVDAGQIVLRIDEVPVADVVAGVVRALEPLAARKVIRLEVDTAGAGDVPADLYRLTQIIATLAGNAVRMTPDGGRVTIGARRLVDALEIYVSDTGKGVAEDERRRMSSDHLPADGAKRPEEQAVTARMTLVRHYVELHGGSVAAPDRAGDGDIFTFTLPLKSDLNKPGKTKLGVRILRRRQLAQKPRNVADRDGFDDPYAVAAIVADIRKARRG